MYIFQNALNNIIRNRGRNALMSAIIFAIIVTTVAALMINNTAAGIIDDYKSRFGSEVTIAPMPGAVRASGGIMPMITDEMTLAFSESEYIKETVLTALDELNVFLGMDTILEITAIASLLATAAGLAAISKITKYEPIKILMERAWAWYSKASICLPTRLRLKTSCCQ